MTKKQEFKQLKSEWYAKLKDEGFKDIETIDGELKDNTMDRIGRNTYSNLKGNVQEDSVKALTAKSVWNAKHDYYYYAEHFLNSYNFKSDIEKMLWANHANGLTLKESVQAMPKNVAVSMTAIKPILKRLAEEMKKQYGIK